MKADQFLRSAVLELKDIDESALVPDLVLADIGLDSLDYVEIQLGVKKAFGVVVDPNLFISGQINTLGELSNYIESHRAGPVPNAVPAHVSEQTT